MLGNMLAYPFALLTRKPATVLGGFLTYFLFLIGLDISFAALGQDLLSADADIMGSDRAAFQFYNLVSGVVALGIAAWVMGGALIDLKRRPAEERPSALDGVKFFVLNIKFGVIVVLPFALTTLLVAGGAGYLFRAGTWPWMAPTLVSLPIALAFAYVGVRLYLAWARALAVDDVHLLRAWQLTKGKFWLTLAMILIAHVVGLAPLVAWTFLTQLFELYVWGPVDTLEAVLTPEVLGLSAALNATAAFSVIYLAITPAFMFDALDPVRPDVADVF